MWQALDKVRGGASSYSTLSEGQHRPQSLTMSQSLTVVVLKQHVPTMQRMKGHQASGAGMQRGCQLLGHGTATRHASHPSAWLPRAPGAPTSRCCPVCLVLPLEIPFRSRATVCDPRLQPSGVHGPLRAPVASSTCHPIIPLVAALPSE